MLPRSRLWLTKLYVYPMRPKKTTGSILLIKVTPPPAFQVPVPANPVPPVRDLPSTSSTKRPAGFHAHTTTDNESPRQDRRTQFVSVSLSQFQNYFRCRHAPTQEQSDRLPTRRLRIHS